ncbi:MAG: flagellar biosynthetic protein FliO [Gammaproteobacteria bacterium]|nr:flagellar biosynthetic protein FliO [Gammaproteobacteria bacterium]
MKRTPLLPGRATALAVQATVLAAVLWAVPVLAETAPTSPATGGLPAGDLTSAAIRMVIGLAVVLGLLGVTAWASRRFRVGARLQGGAIEVVSGISLGARERVVVLRVNGEQVLVGISPAGLRTLHVLNRASTEFSGVLERQK